MNNTKSAWLLIIGALIVGLVIGYLMGKNQSYNLGYDAGYGEMQNQLFGGGAPVPTGGVPLEAVSAQQAAEATNPLTATNPVVKVVEQIQPQNIKNPFAQ